MSSRVCPPARRLRSSSVLARSSASVSFSRSGSIALISSTTPRSLLTLRRCPAPRTLTRTLNQDLRIYRERDLHRSPGYGYSCLGIWAVQVDELLAHGVEHRLHARMEVELLEDVAHVVLDRVLRDVQPASDLTVGEPVGREAEHLELPVGELRTRRPLVGAFGHRRKLAHE